MPIFVRGGLGKGGWGGGKINPLSFGPGPSGPRPRALGPWALGPWALGHGHSYGAAHGHSTPQGLKFRWFLCPHPPHPSTRSRPHEEGTHTWYGGFKPAYRDGAQVVGGSSSGVKTHAEKQPSQTIILKPSPTKAFLNITVSPDMPCLFRPA